MQSGFCPARVRFGEPWKHACSKPLDADGFILRTELFGFDL